MCSVIFNSSMEHSRTRLEITLHPGDEYIGSLDPESLQVLTYVKLTNVSVSCHVTTSYSTWQSPTGFCPLLKHGSSVSVSKPEKVVDYLKTQGCNLDEHLKDYQLAEILAYSALLHDRLLPAILYSRWLDSQNYVDVTRSSHTKLLYFPLSIFYLSWQHKAMQQYIMRGALPETTLEQRGIELLSKAEECIDLLSARLGDSEYFFGSSPSSLDAFVFGFLEVILQCPLPSRNVLFDKVHSCVNLTKFCERIRRDCFPDKKKRLSPKTTTTVSTLPTSLWKDPTWWVSVGVVALVLGVQGVRVGLFRRLHTWLTSDQQKQSTQHKQSTFNPDSDYYM